MNTSKKIALEKHGEIAVVYLKRPGKANAYDQEMLIEIDGLCERFESDYSLKVLIFTGEGSSFCAGADRQELKTRTTNDVLNLRSQRVFERISRLPQICLAAINGPAIAGGFELAMACDLRIASDTAFFALPETSLGIIPAAGGTQRLVQLVGLSRAKMVILGGLQVSAAQAVQWGLLLEVVEGEDLLPTALQLGDKLKERDFEAQRLAKEILRCEGPMEMGLRLETLAQAHLVNRSR